jgi:hypothetical protein
MVLGNCSAFFMLLDNSTSHLFSPSNLKTAYKQKLSCNILLKNIKKAYICTLKNGGHFSMPLFFV